MSRSSRVRAIVPLCLTLGAAEAAVRLLAPREQPPVRAPVAPSEVFSHEEIRRGRAFARPQQVLALARSAVETVVLVALIRRPPQGLDRIVPGAAGGAAAGAGLSILLVLAPLPVSAVARRRALAAGLVTQSWGGWAADVGKAGALGVGFAAAAGAAVSAATARWPRSWWLVGAGGSVAFGAAMAALAPVLLDPIFNAFRPLAPGETREDVLALARAASVHVGEVYSVDASRRGTAANAYVTGLGPTKRVVLFDTLLSHYSRQEVAVVVAHELAHVRGRDVGRGVAFAAVVAAPAALAASQLAELVSASPPQPSALPALALALGVVGAPLGLIANRLSRMLERRADAVSLELTHDPEAFISFERKVALQNLADLDPPAWLTTLLSTHPPTLERIGLARSLTEPGGP